MESRACFDAACAFASPPPRVPVDYLAHRRTDAALRAWLGCATEAELLDTLGCDFYYLTCRDISQNEGYLKCYRGPALDMTESERTCPLGIRWQRGAYDSKFSVDEALAGPLGNATSARDVLAHPWPTRRDFDFTPLIEECEAQAKRVRIGGLWTGIMGDAYRMVGFERFLLNVAMDTDFVKTLVNRMTEMYLDLNDAAFETLKGKLDVWFFGNDFGSQGGLLMRPETWHEIFFENIRRLTALAHAYGLKVMMHSCGAIAELIPALIEAGVELLDPIQVTARGMEPGSLGETSGGRIVFHGGVDTQHVLPTATPEEVARHVEDVTAALGRRGGYILAPSQLLGPDIPLENIAAMYGVAAV